MAMLFKSENLVHVLLLFCFSWKTKAAEICSTSKNIDRTGYLFIREDKIKAAEYGCRDGCLYKLEEDYSIKPAEICFRDWELKAMSIEKPVTLGGCLGNVG